MAPSSVWSTMLACGLGLGSQGCARQLDMSRAYDARKPAMTVAYTAVREETRLYPDYGPIDRGILVEDKPSKKGKAP